MKIFNIYKPTNGWTNRSNDRVTNQSADRLTKRNVSDMYPDHKTEHLRLFRNTQVYKRNMIAYQNVQLLFLCFRYGSHAYWFARWLVGWSFGRVTFFKIFKIFNNGLCDGICPDHDDVAAILVQFKTSSTLL